MKSPALKGVLLFALLGGFASLVAGLRAGHLFQANLIGGVPRLLSTGHRRTALGLAYSMAWAGNSDAQRLLGDLYEQGSAAPRDFSRAFMWYRKAAAGGNVAVQEKLGEFYMIGRGVARDYDEAFRWSSRAAERGSAPAADLLGVMYHHGLGRRYDYAMAVEWYRRAADGGIVSSQANLAMMYEHGFGTK